jgi:hypothetical protein
VLLDRRLSSRRLQGLDVGGNVDRLDVNELDDVVLLKPSEKMTSCPVICKTGVLLRIVAAKNSKNRRAA